MRLSTFCGLHRDSEQLLSIIIPFFFLSFTVLLLLFPFLLFYLNCSTYMVQFYYLSFKITQYFRILYINYQELLQKVMVDVKPIPLKITPFVKTNIFSASGPELSIYLNLGVHL
jgi:hypothetical protein